MSPWETLAWYEGALFGGLLLEIAMRKLYRAYQARRSRRCRG
ncbi:hypothetical protein [Pseudomonas sp. B26(2017)]|nr:hypothetical protein [Pseudomonas sp. B26(2017)]